MARTRRLGHRALEADAVLVGLDAQVDDLREVQHDGAVGRLDLAPAAVAPWASAWRSSASFSSLMRRESTCPPWKPIAARLAVMLAK